MQECLYHPLWGYYTRPDRGRVTGLDGDFVTAPTLHPFFGMAIAREIAAAWARVGSPSTYRVCEFGGGEGDLARMALQWLDSQESDLAKAIQWLHVESSPRHQSVIQAKPDSRIEVTTSMEAGGSVVGGPVGGAGGAVGGATGGVVGGAVGDGMGDAGGAVMGPAANRAADFLLANEFLDAIPANVLEWSGNAVKEVRVAGDSDFHEVLHERPDLRADGRTGRTVELGQTEEWMAHALRRQDGHGPQTILFIDYGRRDVAPTPDSPLRGFRGQRLVEDVLRDPGDIDITYDVDFAWVARTAAQLGFSEVAYETQEAFLLRHGILEALNGIDRGTVAGASSYLRLRQLLLPTGMGAAFKVQRLER